MGPQPYVLMMILRPVSLVSPLDHHWTVSLRVKVAFCSRRGPQSWDKNPRGLQNSTYLVRKLLLFKAAWCVFIEEYFLRSLAFSPSKNLMQFLLSGWRPKWQYAAVS